VHLILVFVEVINNIREKPIEHLQSSINLQDVSIANELEDKVEKWLKNSLVLELVHTTLDLDQNIS